MTANRKLAAPVRKLTSLVRPKYSPGLLLQDDDLTAGIDYTRQLSRMLFRTLFGGGVLCGLVVHKPALNPCGKLAIVVEKGMALSCAGDPIEVPAEQEITLDTCGEPIPETLWIGVKHIEACCAPRAAQCSPDEDEPTSACTRDHDGFELRLFAERPPGTCGGCDQLGKAVQVAELQIGKEAGKTKGKGENLGLDTSKTANAKTSTKTKAEAAKVEPPPAANDDPCLCNLRTAEGACYFPFYDGQCACDCCDGEWTILALATRQGEGPWSVDHSVRRFVRPVLMRDPQIAKDSVPPTPAA